MERYSRRGPRKYFQRCCYFFFFSKSKIILSLNYPIIQLVFIVLLSPRSIQEWVRQIPTSWSLESSGEADSVRDMPFLCDHFCHVGLQCWLLLLTSMHACMPAKLLQSCLTLCDPMDCSLLSSFVHGILQARILEWIAMPSSRGSSPPRDRTHVS